MSWLPFCSKLKSLPTSAFENIKKYFWIDRSVKLKTKVRMNAETTILKIKLIYRYHMKAYEMKNIFPHSNFWISTYRLVKMHLTRCYQFFSYRIDFKQKKNVKIVTFSEFFSFLTQTYRRSGIGNHLVHNEHFHLYFHIIRIFLW